MSGDKLPVLRAEELASILESVGFENTRKSKGSHFRFCHPDGRKTTIPFHQGKAIGKGLLRKILRDAELTPEDLRELLGKGKKK
jgi:predicted RNA binding protein YcfA (HicA-like mRNA interferase family)